MKNLMIELDSTEPNSLDLIITAQLKNSIKIPIIYRTVFNAFNSNIETFIPVHSTIIKKI